MKSLCLILLLALATSPACSRFTASGRRERAYANYIHKSQTDQARRQAKFRKEKAKMPRQAPESSEPRETTQTSEGPQAAPRDSGNQ